MTDPPERWQALGFTVSGGRVGLGGVSVELGCPGRGVTAWRLSGVQAAEAIDGLVTEDEGDVTAPGREQPDSQPGSAVVVAPTHDMHPNGALSLDHVVVLTPDFDRTAAALASAGLPLRRIRQASPEMRQGFRRLGPSILELVEEPGADPGPARFWGLVVTVRDLKRLAVDLGERLGAVRPAVQPGREIATLRPSAGLDEALAFMTPEPAQSSATLD